MTGVHVGTVTMIADAGSVAAGVTLTVTSAATSGALAARITISGQKSLSIGQSTTLSAVAVDARGNVVSGLPVVWTSSIPAVATISASGEVRAVTPGTTMISATGGGVTGSIQVAVGNAAATVLVVDYALELSPPGSWQYNATLAPGQAMQLRATAKNSNGQVYSPQPTLIWQSAHPNFATVDSSGLVTAIAIGTSTIRLVHAVGDAGTVTFLARTTPPTTLAFGESRELGLPAGVLQMALAGLPTLSNTSSNSDHAFSGPLLAGKHYTFIAAGSGLNNAVLLPFLDDHPAIPSGLSMVRIVMAGQYEASYNGNLLYLVDTGAPIPPGSPADGDFEAGSVLAWGARPAGAFDIVLVDIAATGATGAEAARFTVTPTPGRATTYIITGATKASLQLVQVEDP